MHFVSAVDGKMMKPIISTKEDERREVDIASNNESYSIQVSQHTELAWVLGCLTTLPRLGQLPQFKEKSAKMAEIPLGLYIYPVLQAADILLYK